MRLTYPFYQAEEKMLQRGKFPPVSVWKIGTHGQTSPRGSARFSNPMGVHAKEAKEDVSRKGAKGAKGDES